MPICQKFTLYGIVCFNISFNAHHLDDISVAELLAQFCGRNLGCP